MSQAVNQQAVGSNTDEELSALEVKRRGGARDMLPASSDVPYLAIAKHNILSNCA
jgi:hypothetical protein